MKRRVVVKVGRGSRNVGVLGEGDQKIVALRMPVSGILKVLLDIPIPSQVGRLQFSTKTYEAIQQICFREAEATAKDRLSVDLPADTSYSLTASGHYYSMAAPDFVAVAVAALHELYKKNGAITVSAADYPSHGNVEKWWGMLTDRLGKAELAKARILAN